MLFLNNAEFSAIMVIQKGVSGMPDYKEMYLHLMRETEAAIRILVKAQQDCEELYLLAPGFSPAPRRGEGARGEGGEAAARCCAAIRTPAPHLVPRRRSGGTPRPGAFSCPPWAGPGPGTRPPQPPAKAPPRGEAADRPSAAAGSSKRRSNRERSFRIRRAP